MAFEKREEKKDGRAPDFRAREGVAIWVNKDKNGKEYLTVDVPLLNIRVHAFAVDKEGEHAPSA